MKPTNLVAIAALLLLSWGTGGVSVQAQILDDYSSIPPFLGNPVTPNVLLLVDNSGSMNNCAYPDTSPAADHCQSLSGAALSDQYISTDTYYGYFEPDKCYSYAATKFSPIGSTPCANAWDGNFLNWITMRRIDITKWVMTGGQCNAIRSSENSCATLRGQFTFSAGACCKVFYKQFNLTGLAPSTYTTMRCMRVAGGDFVILGIGVACSASAAGDTYSIRVDAGVKQTGVIQEVGNEARFGLMVFDDDLSNENGAEIRSDIGANLVSMVNAIEGLVATSWTPLAESLYEAARYFAQIPPAYETNDYTVNVNNDPYCFSNLTPPPGETGCKTPTQGRWVPCCQSFVILFTDGQPTMDFNSSPRKAGEAALLDYAHTAASHGTSVHCGTTAGCTVNSATAPHTSGTAPYASHNDPLFQDHHDNCSAYYGGTTGDSCGAKGSHQLDDVAYWAHTTDLRPASGNIAVINTPGNANGLTGIQNLTIYTFFAFGTGAPLLKDAAKAGGFDDFDGNGIPYTDATCGTATPNPSCAEWDRDGNNVPDTYFESANAYTLRTSLVAAITDILQRSSSGTSVSVLATTSGGEGAIYQAYFYPFVDEGFGEIAWLGYLQGLFFDQDGQLREDTDSNGRLVLNQDKIIETYFDFNFLETRVRRYNVDANGDRTGLPVEISLSDLSPIWEAGKVLANRNLAVAPRTIKTWVDGNGNGVVDAGEFIDFASANEITLRPYLRAATAAEGNDIISFISGNSVAGYRSREVTVDATMKTWRLGDVIYSSPVAVGAPVERFDLKYQDSSYNRFYEKYKGRRQVIYVGANDGMLHAFNGGFFTAGDDPATSTAVEHGWFTTDSKALGQELWAFIPQELLPHLKWLTGTNYDKSKHVYYVDGTPRVTDAQIFTEEAACATSLADAGCVHPSGWGTVLIGSMRLGGGLLRTDLNGNGVTTDPGEDRFRSAYFAMDITNPESTPTLLWVYNEADLGFTTSWPAIIRFDSSTWYAVFGSGPVTYKGERNASLLTNKFPSTVSEYGQLYIVNLRNGTLANKIAVDALDRYAFMGSPVVYDLPRDYATDVLYIGKTYASGGAWVGKVHRLIIYTKDPTWAPTSWGLSVAFDAQKPVLVRPTATRDRANRLWLFFGTGRFFSAGPSSDQTDMSAQALYGMKESSPNGCWDMAAGNWKASCPTLLASDLVDVTNVAVDTSGNLTCGGGCPGSATTLSGLVNDVINSSSAEKAGWLVNLTGGERVLYESTVIGGIVAVTSYTPGADICLPQGINALYAIYYESGTAFPSTDSSGNVVGPIGLSGTTVLRKADLGIGVASKVNIVISETTTTGFVQSSTGEIIQIQGIELGSNVKSGTRVFREKSE